MTRVHQFDWKFHLQTRLSFWTDQKILTRTFNLLSINKAAEFILRAEYTRNNRRSVQSAVAGATTALSARINFQNYVGIISRGLITLWNVGAPTIRRTSSEQRPNWGFTSSLFLPVYLSILHLLFSPLCFTLWHRFLFSSPPPSRKEKVIPARKSVRIGTRCSSQGTSYSRNNGTRLSILHRTTATTCIDSRGSGGLFARNIEFSVKVYRSFSLSFSLSLFDKEAGAGLRAAE